MSLHERETLSPELRLALACARVSPNEQDHANIQALLPCIDTAAFLAVVQRHRIGPMVHNALVTRNPAANQLPEALTAPLTAEVQANKLRAMKVTRANVLLARMFNSAGIPWVPLKGATLAAAYYGDFTLRHANDIDGWVPARTLQQARELLLAAGYVDDPADNDAELAARGPNHAKFLHWRNYHDVYIGPDRTCLELHWRLTDNPHALCIAPEKMLERSSRVVIAGEALPLLDPIDQLLYLCEHGGKHCWFRLKWLFDLPQLLESRAWDWPAVFARARESRCLNTLNLGLTLAQCLFGWEAPAATKRSAAPGSLQRWRRHTAMQAIQTPGGWWTHDHFGPLSWQINWRLFRISLVSGPSALAYEARRACLSPYDLRSHPVADEYFHWYWIRRPYTLLSRKMAESRNQRARKNAAAA